MPFRDHFLNDLTTVPVYTYLRINPLIFLSCSQSRIFHERYFFIPILHPMFMPPCLSDSPAEFLHLNSRIGSRASVQVGHWRDWSRVIWPRCLRCWWTGCSGRWNLRCSPSAEQPWQIVQSIFLGSSRARWRTAWLSFWFCCLRGLRLFSYWSAWIAGIPDSLDFYICFFPTVRFKSSSTSR